MDDFLIAAHFRLNLHPLLRGKGRCGGLDDVLGDDFAAELQIGPRGTDRRGRTGPLAFVGKELELQAEGKPWSNRMLCGGCACSMMPLLRFTYLGASGIILPKKRYSIRKT
ncbi:hypothetical protein EMGBS8_15280 [Verrucomicrobiota bacterium]|nr:hypothetical protein EMGBS8_15280 [Verrucomicrobiota bacterium]